MIKNTFYDKLNKIRELINKDLYKLLIGEDAIIAGYELIKSNKSSLYPAIHKLEGKEEYEEKLKEKNTKNTKKFFLFKKKLFICSLFFRV